MKLTREEQEMLDGRCGGAAQKAMELLVAVGECNGAEKMVPVASAHLVAANPVNAGKGGTCFIKEMAEKHGRFVVPTTTNPASLDPWAWREMGFSEDLDRELASLSSAIAGMGGFLCNTCTPYLIGHAPRMGQHVAWGESSAILYANSVLGSRTNREGGPTGLAAGITGRTPAYGYHLDENRYGTLKVVVTIDLEGDADYATLGYFAGRIAQDKVPIFTGIPPSVSQHELKCLGAALSVSGSVALFHVVGVTPEAPTEETASGSRKVTSSGTFEFGASELRETMESISGADPKDARLVVLGCPHASIDQLKGYAQAFSGRKARDKTDIWILVSHIIKQYAKDIGLASTIEAAGIRLVSNTCPAAMPRDFFRRRGYTVVASDSPKMVYYVSTTQGVPCCFGKLNTLLENDTTKNGE